MEMPKNIFKENALNINILRFNEFILIRYKYANAPGIRYAIVDAPFVDKMLNGYKINKKKDPNAGILPNNNLIVLFW
jgi:hypothetical protein